MSTSRTRPAPHTDSRRPALFSHAEADRHTAAHATDPTGHPVPQPVFRAPRS